MVGEESETGTGTVFVSPSGRLWDMTVFARYNVRSLLICTNMHCFSSSDFFIDFGLRFNNGLGGTISFMLGLDDSGCVGAFYG